MYKIIGADQKEYGPVTSGQIRQWISEGRINGWTQARADGTQEWSTLNKLPEFEQFWRTPSGAAPMVGRPPPAIKVFGILNIVFGSLALLCSPLSFAGIPRVSRQFGYGPLMQDWLLCVAIMTLIGGGIMLASGIGLCNFRSWARKLAVYYGIFDCVRVLLNFFVSAVHLANVTSMPMPEARRLGMVFGFVVGVLVGLTYNGLLIFFLSRQTVKEALGETGRQI